MTYTTNIRLDDAQAAAVKAYATASGGITIADAIRILITKGLSASDFEGFVEQWISDHGGFEATP